MKISPVLWKALKKCARTEINASSGDPGSAERLKNGKQRSPTRFPMRGSHGPDRTRVTATIAYEPEGLLEKTGDALGIPSGRVQADLERFCTFIEERGRETGGWRGQIEGEKTAESGSVSAGRSGLGFDKDVGEKLQGLRREQRKPTVSKVIVEPLL